MTATEFSRQTALYENSLPPEIRKTKGIFYTGIWLANKILAELDVPADAMVLDPCCGTGSFNYAAMMRGIKCVYGTDIDKSAIKFCMSALPGGSFVVADSIEKNGHNTLSCLGLQSKPDYVVGNPPYTKWMPSKAVASKFSARVVQTGNNTFTAALMRAMEMVRENGTVSYIVPKNFLHVATYRSLRTEILRTQTLISVIDIGAYFPNVRGEQVVLTFRNSRPTPRSHFDVKKLIDGEFVSRTRIAQAEFSDEIILLSGDTDHRIYSRLRDYPTQESLRIARGRGRAVSGKDIRKFGFKQMPIPKSGHKIFVQNIYSAEAGIIAAFGGEMDPGETVTVISADSHRQCSWLLGVMHSRIYNFFLYRYCYNYSKLTMHTDAKYLKKVPVPPVADEVIDRVISLVDSLESETYMSDRWFEQMDRLDNIMYEVYGLDNDEKQFVESEMKIIHSPKWTKSNEPKR